MSNGDRRYAHMLELIANGKPFSVDEAGWLWVSEGQPISPVVVNCWRQSGWIEEYGAATVIISKRGLQVLGRK